MSGFKLHGMSQLRRKLRELERKVESVSGDRSVPFEELLTKDFLIRYTNFTSVEDMFQQSGFAIETQEDFTNIPYDQWDQFINRNTQFTSWQDMLSTAASEWLQIRLNLEKD